jgi:pimeloyl-ACP methyl ester carboxylesterase
MTARGGIEQVRTVRRPETSDAPAFDLAYVRAGERSPTPIVVLPGGPGLASLRPYRGLRRRAARGGLDLIMVEHRGIGRSRTDLRGAALPLSAMRIAAVLDDVAAVIDQERADRAIIAGSSYGSYLAAAFGVRHPERVDRMLLDSPLQSSADLALERAAIRSLLWDGGDHIAAAMRRLVATGADERTLLDVARAAWELGGRNLLEPLVQHRIRRGRGLAWRALEAYAGRGDAIARIPGVYEFDLVGAIAFRELDYGAAPDGLPLDPALTYAPLAARFPAFEGEPYDLPAATPGFSWPLVVLTGTRDIRTPSAIAERVASTARDAVLVRLENGHSALDTHPLALLRALWRLSRGDQQLLADETSGLDALPRRGLSARLPSVLDALQRIDALVPR